ncbi:hypothetical protein HMPREF3213_01831 [Heyndrickxia coagulans]|uniref:Uncharacterized protein n=1 Tax=Heyndrickxia coagulans TaxID=1398 RepID=A0A133KQI2_HEYCO|nr:hypothetical protein HMPREF3213_01831 [Heyndrickxia coagulans]
MNAIRALLNEGSVNNDIWSALAWCITIMAIAYFFANKALNASYGKPILRKVNSQTL